MDQNFEFISHQLIKKKIKTEDITPEEESEDNDRYEELSMTANVKADNLWSEGLKELANESNEPIDNLIVIPDGDQSPPIAPPSSSRRKTSPLSDRVRSSVRTTETGPFKCSVNGCQKQYGDQDTLVQHLRMDHNFMVSVVNGGQKVISVMKNMVIKCSIKECGKMFLLRTDLNQHLRADHNIANIGPELTEESNNQLVNGISGQRTCNSIGNCWITGCNKPLPDMRHVRHHLEVDHKIITDYRKLYKREPPVRDDNWSVEPSIETGKPLDIQLKEAIINLRTYLQKKNPYWKRKQVIVEVTAALNLKSPNIVYQVIREYRKNKCFKLEAGKSGPKRRRFFCTEEDREVIDQCIEKLKDENRLNSVSDVYYEISTNNEFNVSFKGCSLPSFYRIFEESGFRILLI